MNSQNPSELQARLARLAAHFALPEAHQDAAPPRLIGPESVGAREVTGRRGRYWLRSVAYSPREPWGETLVEASAQACRKEGLRVPFQSFDARIPLDECLFLDCETTGLSGGAGTVAFLIALGRLAGDEFVVDQYFLPDLSDEPAVLDEVTARLDARRAVVTYNGSAFDLPLLEGRFNFWRIDSEFRGLPHLDLLWPTRALFKHRLPSCALSTVEEQLLRIARIEDLPGAEVPEVYFQYLREGESPRLHAVFEHNRLDVVSLFVYSLWLDERTHPAGPLLESPDDLRALARYWYRHRRSDAALRALDEAALRVNDAGQKSEIHRMRGHILKRDREYDSAHSEWELAARSSPGDVSVAEELAKHLEHRRRDYAAALAITEQALAALEFRSLVGDDSVTELRERLLYRHARLKRKLRCA